MMSTQLKVKFTKNNTLESERPEKYFNHAKVVITDIDSADSPLIGEAFAIIEAGIQDYQERGSGLTIDHIQHLQVHLNPYKPIRGSTYCPLPAAIARRLLVSKHKGVLEIGPSMAPDEQ